MAAKQPDKSEPVKRKPSPAKGKKQAQGHGAKPQGAALIPRKELFRQEMLRGDGNATRAAIAAGYSPKTAYSQASRLLKNVELQQELKEAGQKLLQEIKVTNEQIITAYARIAFLDPRRFYDEKGQLLPVNLLPLDVASALTGFETSSISAGKDAEGSTEHIRTTKIKFNDPIKALDSLARIQGMFKDTVKVEVVSYQEKLQKARERANRNR